MNHVLEEPLELEPGYQWFKGRDLALMDRKAFEARAAVEGPLTDPLSWLAVSDAICFAHEVLPPDLVVLVLRPYCGSSVCEREGGGR